MRYAAHLWKNADTETRTQFQVQYYSDLEKYLDDMQNYNASLTEEQTIALKKVQMQKNEYRYRKMITEVYIRVCLMLIKSIPFSNLFFLTEIKRTPEAQEAYECFQLVFKI